MNRLYKFVLCMTSLGLHHCQMLRGSETSYSENIVRGINWFGYETEYKNLMCLWTHDIDWHLTTMKTVGFNSAVVASGLHIDYIRCTSMVDRAFSGFRRTLYHFNRELHFSGISREHVSFI